MTKKKTKTKTTMKAVEPVDFSRDGEGKPPEIVAMLPVICPRCRSTDRKSFKDGRDRVADMPGIKVEPTLGVRYDRIIYRRTVCNGCGQRLDVREFTMRPEDE